MSRQNVEIVRRFLDRAHAEPDAVWDIFDEEVYWDIGSLSMPDFPRAFYGPDGVQAFFRLWTGPFRNWGYDIDEVISSHDAVAVQIHQWGSGKGSGVTVDDRFWQVWTMRDGKAVRVTHHRGKADALQEIGLSEQDAHADS